jgi:hypothetical protein
MFYFRLLLRGGDKMSTLHELVLLLGFVSIVYGMICAICRWQIAAGYALLLGGACVGEWSANHIMTSPIHIAWPGLLLLVMVPLSYMFFGIVILIAALLGDD